MRANRNKDMDRPPPSLDKAGAEQDRIAREKDTASINEGVCVISAFVLFRNGDIPTADNLRAALQIKLSEIKDKADASQPYSFVAFFIWRHFPLFAEQNFRDLAPEEAELLVYTFREVL